MISIIIPVYRSAELLRRCLSAIMNVDYSGPKEVIVVDDGSPNGDAIAFVANEFRVKLISMAHRSGAAAARNKGAAAAIGDIILFIDADVEAHKDLLKEVHSSIALNGHVAAIGAYTKHCPESNFASIYKNLVHYYFLHNVLGTFSNYFATYCGAIKRQTFWECNGFDENYKGATIEDVEFGSRLRKAGNKIYINRRMQVTHLKKYSLASLVLSDLFDRAIPFTRLILQTRDTEIVPEYSMSAKICTIASYLLMVSMVLAIIFRSVSFVLISFICFLLILSLNSKFLLFIQKTKNLLFCAKAFLILCVYYQYCGLGFTLGYLSFHYANIKKAC